MRPAKSAGVTLVDPGLDALIQICQETAVQADDGDGQRHAGSSVVVGRPDGRHRSAGEVEGEGVRILGTLEQVKGGGSTLAWGCPATWN